MLVLVDTYLQPTAAFQDSQSYMSGVWVFVLEIFKLIS